MIAAWACHWPIEASVYVRSGAIAPPRDEKAACEGGMYRLILMLRLRLVRVIPSMTHLSMHVIGLVRSALRRQNFSHLGRGLLSTLRDVAQVSPALVS